MVISHYCVSLLILQTHVLQITTPNLKPGMGGWLVYTWWSWFPLVCSKMEAPRWTAFSILSFSTSRCHGHHFLNGIGICIYGGYIYISIYIYSGSARVLPKKDSKKTTYMHIFIFIYIHLAQHDCWEAATLTISFSVVPEWVLLIVRVMGGHS